MYKNIQAIILAGGQSSRFKTGTTKLVEKICGKELILYPLDLTTHLNIQTTVVVGFQQEEIIDIIRKNNPENPPFFIRQNEIFDYKDAIQKTQHLWTQNHILFINADIPLLTELALKQLYEKHIESNADASFITSESAYAQEDSHCKVLIENNHFSVVDSFDFLTQNSDQCRISAGIYLIKKSILEKYIDKTSTNTSTDEYYLPELIALASKENCLITTTNVPYDIIREVNTLEELWVVEHIKRSQIISYWMNHGVRFINSLNTIIDSTVTIESGATISSGVHLLGQTTIKERAFIGPCTYIQDSIIEKEAHVASHSVITHSTIDAQIHITPFSHISYQYMTNHTKHKAKANSSLFIGATKIDEMDLNS